MKEDTGHNDEPKTRRITSVLPDLWKLIRPRRLLLAFSFLLLVINRITGLALPYSGKFLMDSVIPQRPIWDWALPRFLKVPIHYLNTTYGFSLLALMVLGIVLAAIIQGLTSFALTQLLSKEGQRLIAEMRRRVQAHIGRLSIAYYDSKKTGALVSRIMTDVEGLQNLVGTGLVEFTGGLMTAVIVLVLMVRISYTMTGLALGALLLFAFVMQRAFTRVRPIFNARRKINAEVTGRLTESLGGVRVVKGYHAEAREEAVFSLGVERLLQNAMQTLTATAGIGMAATIVMGGVGALIVYTGAKAVTSGEMTPGDLLQFILFMGFLIAPVIQVANIGTQVTEALAGLDRTREVLSEIPEHADPGRTIAIPRIEGHLSFQHVSFGYDPGKLVLEDISFEAAQGSVTALIGSSGSGKSTIIGLIAAFYKPLEGKVLIDGVDLSKVRLESYRSVLGVVLQESFLFDGTIGENIAFSRPEAKEDEIMHACRIAYVDEFASQFKDGYDTIIGERGIKLSGGQRQRVSIARAVLADPRILILDEATSSLDSESEAFIQEGLKYLMKGRTTFVIAHRLSTIRQADQILVVEAGRIVERGTHRSLYELRGRYFELYTKQHGLESNLLLAAGEGNSPDEKDQEGTGSAPPPISPLGLLRGPGL